MAVTTETIDKCMYDIYHNLFLSNEPLQTDLELFYSGHQPADTSISDNFYWVKTNSYNDIDSFEKIDDETSYQRWLDDADLNANEYSCIAGKIPAGERTFDKYGWTTVDCDKNHRYVCRIDCSEIYPTPPPPPIPDSANGFKYLSFLGGFIYVYLRRILKKNR